MEIHQLRCFLSVAEERNFGRAAESLNLTPSPVSRAIKALESELGTQLFERGYHTVELTSAGELLAKGAAPLLVQFDELKRRVVAQNADARVVVGGTPFAPPSIFDLFTDTVRAASGNRAVHVDVADALDRAGRGHLDRLGRNEMDLALLSLPFERPGIDFCVIAELEMSVGIRSDDPLAARGAVTWEDLRGHRLTIPRRTPQPSTLNWMRDQVERAGHRLVDEATGPDVTALAAHVRGNPGGFFLALEPGVGGPWKVPDDPAFAVVPFAADGPRFALCLAWNRQRHAGDAALAALVDRVLVEWRQD
ncbi:LysR family transcriptional regulator [Rhodococcus opacus]|uniref:LysR family transcriptional regulator n=1 Tax=Rhodococcus opacus TaxID=37919 RepID=UPI001C43D207|nr:LysR family transcriptional regulator [Rhodococcus opacus]MBV6756252.1 LysR family transcriptional regulator [Rhodococcus opacus]